MVHERQGVEYHARLKQLFFVAIELDCDERSRFVRSACGEDRELRADLESLLNHHRRVVSADTQDTGEP